MNSFVLSSWVVGWRLRLLFAVVGLLLLARAPARAQVCVGDCDSNGAVVIDELMTCVAIALERLPLGYYCPACDANQDGRVKIGELIKGVKAALTGCPRERCGFVLCPPGQVCCNPLGGICVQPGDSCTQ